MPIARATEAPTFHLDGLHVVGRAAPSRGSTETAVWEIAIAPGAPGALHSVDREEIFVCLSGRAQALLGAERLELAPGDALVVPAHTPFSLANSGPEPFRAVCVLPVGGKAALPGGEPFTPPWAQ
jgi:mannose-6-phosphate isomerase-like protein (cupin superfamily)